VNCLVPNKLNTSTENALIYNSSSLSLLVQYFAVYKHSFSLSMNLSLYCICYWSYQWI